MDIQQHWLNQIANLKVDVARGDPAPHKRLLLLVVLDLAEEGLLQQEILPLNGELAFRFCTYWTVVAARRQQRPDIHLPFHHLKSGGFWQALMSDGKPSPDKKLTAYAKLDSSFLRCVNEAAFRTRARRLIVSKTFKPEEQVALCELLQMLLPEAAQVVKETEALKYAAAKETGREGRFRLTVVPAYNYTCALTGYRMVTIGTESIIEAAHIHRFADSRNNDPRNGMALCKNAHGLFDLGLWSLTDDCRVLVALDQFDEAGPEPFLLKAMQGRRIQLPSDAKLWPNPIHLAWHRSNKFKAT
jgi:putative restriction endonuclease